MILAVDVGNSNTTVGLFDAAGRLSFLSALETDKDKTKDRCAIDLLGVFGLYGAEIGSVDGAILSSVVPSLTATMTAAVGRLIGCSPMVVGPGIKTGLNIKAEIHNQLGSDIVASSVAAIHKYPSPSVVIDMGTATSMSLLKGSVYEGCILMPGLRLALEALSERAAALPPISMETAAPVPLLGRTTEDAMRSGVLYGPCQHGGRHDRAYGGSGRTAGHGGGYRRKRRQGTEILHTQYHLRCGPGHGRALSAVSKKCGEAPEGVTHKTVLNGVSRE